MDIQDSATVTAKTEDEALSAPNSSEESVSTKQPGWRAKLAPWCQATLAVLPAFLLTRCIFLLLTYFGTVLFTVPNYSYQALPLSAVLRSWYRWDVVNFEKIARIDYSIADPTKAAFFPLYPWLERWVSSLLHIYTSVFL